MVFEEKKNTAPAFLTAKVQEAVSPKEQPDTRAPTVPQPMPPHELHKDENRLVVDLTMDSFDEHKKKPKTVLDTVDLTIGRLKNSKRESAKKTHSKTPNLA